MAALTQLPRLRSLHFSPNLFSTAKIAWLKAHLRADIESDSLQALRRLEPSPLRQLDTLIMGKGKPFLQAAKDQVKIARYQREFEELLALYRKQPDLAEPG